MRWIIRTDEIIAKALMAIMLFCAICLFGVMLSNVIIRIFRIGSLMNWYAEVIEILFSWMVMSGASILCRNKGHFVVDLLQNKFGRQRWYYLIKIVTTLIPLLFFCALFFYGIKLVQAAVQTMPILHIQRRWAYLCIPFNAFFLCIYSIRDFLEALGIFAGIRPMPQ